MTGAEPEMAESAALPRRVVDAAAARGLRLATAESLTGGLVAARICEIPGASAVFTGGVVSYTHEVKRSLLGVDAELLEQCGAVDPEVARQMAEGALRACGADLAVATTGVAGPEPHDGQPVGTAWLGLAWAEGSRAVLAQCRGDRGQIRAESARRALELLLEGLLDGRGAAGAASSALG